MHDEMKGLISDIYDVLLDRDANFYQEQNQFTHKYEVVP